MEFGGATGVIVVRSAMAVLGGDGVESDGQLEELRVDYDWGVCIVGKVLCGLRLQYIYIYIY